MPDDGRETHRGLPPDSQCTTVTHVLFPNVLLYIYEICTEIVYDHDYVHFTMSILSSMLPSAAAHANETVCQLFSFIQLQGNTDYIGEKVSQLEHSLQCAYLATQDSLYKHDPEVILGALLHDVGRFIPAAKDMPKMIAPDGSYVGRCSHEVLGERYLRQLGFSDKICQLVGAHVMAKRYLTAVEAGYFDSLSKTSKQTLVYQVSKTSQLPNPSS